MPRSAAAAAQAGAAAERPLLPRVPTGQWNLPRRYHLLSILGHGSYGTVCEAHDSSEDRLVAIKRVQQLFGNLEDCKRNLRELAILGSLDHECVVKLHDAFIPGGVCTFSELYSVLEICDSDLKKLVGTDVTISMQHVKFLLYNLLRGLKYLRSAGVIHRDLKSENCLVNRNCIVKICDFNLACVVDDEIPSPRAASEVPGSAEDKATEPAGAAVPSTARARRQLTQRVVSRWYRAPEVILLQALYTAAIDIWSAGCIFAELLQMLEGGMPVEDRGPLFPGATCFPLSPRARGRGQGQGVRRGHDQLSLIFDLLGTPTQAEVDRLDHEEARRYVRSLAPRQGQALRSRFPAVEAPALEVLAGMLRFDPGERLSVDQLLAHGLLEDVRDEERETVAPARLVLGFESEHGLSEVRLRRHFAAEVRRFRRSSVGEEGMGGA
mmetsp:Transcript_88329/g.285936  ORF Transcript_88329/g.285936 Transcript_88329/m.285936 type:complete len:438 (-) Transcript_88329:92-1405(-)